MNEYTQRVGRKYGATAILWDASVKGSITKISFDNKQICGLIFKRIKIYLLIINVYMPCDKNYVDDEYIDVLNEISQTMYKYNPTHIVSSSSGFFWLFNWLLVSLVTRSDTT